MKKKALIIILSLVIPLAVFGLILVINAEMCNPWFIEGFDTMPPPTSENVTPQPTTDNTTSDNAVSDNATPQVKQGGAPFLAIGFSERDIADYKKAGVDITGSIAPDDFVLPSGIVFIELGYKGCHACLSEAQEISVLKEHYGEGVTFIYINVLGDVKAREITALRDCIPCLPNAVPCNIIIADGEVVYPMRPGAMNRSVIIGILNALRAGQPSSLHNVAIYTHTH